MYWVSIMPNYISFNLIYVKLFQNAKVLRYSELAIKTLCGFRDAVLSLYMDSFRSGTMAFKNKPHRSQAPPFSVHPLYHKEKLEFQASRHFRIFVCEGQPKNSTAWGAAVQYHDGKSYAVSLVEHGFTEINLIPDAVATTLVAPFDEGNDKSLNIDFIIVGANGFDDSKFRHSGGHAMVVAACSLAKHKAKESHSLNSCQPPTPKLVLSLMTDKYSAKELTLSGSGTISGAEESRLPGIGEKRKIIEHNGWRFQDAFLNEPVRVKTFFPQNTLFQEQIDTVIDADHENEPPICFYNPREDIIPIKEVDVIITEKAWITIDPQKDATWN